MTDHRDVLVCVPKSYPAKFSNDAFGVCSKCGVEVRYRPHAPSGLVLMCVSCVIPEILASPPEAIGVTPETAREVMLFNSKASGKH